MYGEKNILNLISIDILFCPMGPIESKLQENAAYIIYHQPWMALLKSQITKNVTNNWCDNEKSVGDTSKYHIVMMRKNLYDSV